MSTCRFLATLSLFAAVAAAGSVNPAWIKHYTGPTQTQYNEAADSYLDTLTGNLYVVGAGELAGNPNGLDLVVMKYRPDGTQAWVNGFSGTGSSTGDMAQAVAVDSAGNVYIAGKANNTDYDDAAWAKYDSNGVEIWHRYSGLGGDDEAFDITIGKSGDVYVCGSDSGYGYLTGYLVARISPSNGDTLWTRTYVLDSEALARRSPGQDLHPDYFDNYSLYDNAAAAIAACPDSGVVTTGHGSDFDWMYEWWTMRFTPSGVRSWAAVYHNPLTTMDNGDDDVALGVKVANNGDIYAVGFDYQDNGSTSQGYNYAVVRYSSSGSRLNYRSIDVGSEHGDDYAFSVALDDSSPQNVYVTGTLTYPYPLNEQVSTMKFNNTLTSRWGPAGSTYGSTDDDRGHSVFYRKNRVYVTGLIGNDIIVLGYTAANVSNKDTLWTYRFDGLDQMIDFGSTICAFDSDHVYVSGEVSHTGGWTSIYTTRLRYGHPEMAVTSIVAPQGTFDHYDSVIPLATIRNNGDVIPMVNAFMYIGLPYGDTIQIFDGPAPGQSATFAFRPWAAHPTGLVQVRCSIEVEGDTIPANDFFTDTVQVTPIDVGCRQIAAPAGPVDSGTNTTPVARFRNFGTTPQTFPVWFRIEAAAKAVVGTRDGVMKNAANPLSFTALSHPAATEPLVPVYEDADTITLAPQESASVSFKSWLAAPQDTYIMKAFSSILDDGPANDTISAQLIVRRPRHDVGVSAILAPVDSVDSGAVIIPRAVIMNFGGGRDSFRIRFTIGSFFSRETVMVLTVGSTDTADFAQWTANQVGTHMVRCSTKLVGDSGPANDFVQGQVVVRPAPGVESPNNLSGIPREYSLGSPRPNPFVRRMLVPFALPTRARVSLQLYDAAGGLVRTLTAAELPAGFHNVRWDGTDDRGLRVKPGAYFCRLQTPGYSRIAKLVIPD
jgi:hypothetical protein